MLQSSNFWVRLTNWEYWPFNVVYAPLVPYYAWQSIKRRSFFWFTASNPSIDFGGMLGERKSEIFDLIPKKYIPETVMVSPDISIEEVRAILEEKKIAYPLICKPDIGERGWMVKKIANEADVISYLNEIKVDFLIQEFIDLPIELGVFYYRSPNEEYGKISSIVAKEMLYVEGNGTDTISELIIQKPRARFQLEELSSAHGSDVLNKVLLEGERFELVSIGNHCLGTKFLNGNDWIDKELTEAIDSLAKEVPDFYFGRFDLRCESIESLRKLKDFKIMELNGAGAEPAHIYEPGFPLLKAYKVLFHHLGMLSKISGENRKRGVRYWSTKEGLAKIKEIKLYNRQKD